MSALDDLTRRAMAAVDKIRERRAAFVLSHPPVAPGMVPCVERHSLQHCPECMGSGVASRVERDGYTITFYECPCTSYVRVDRPA